MALNLGLEIWGRYSGTELQKVRNLGTRFLTFLPPSIHPSLLTKFADTVDLKDELLNNRVCTVKFSVVESYFLCNTTNTERHC